mgnify:CR=1 FL=1
MRVWLRCWVVRCRGERGSGVSGGFGEVFVPAFAPDGEVSVEHLFEAWELWLVEVDESACDGGFERVAVGFVFDEELGGFADGAAYRGGEVDEGLFDEGLVGGESSQWEVSDGSCGVFDVEVGAEGVVDAEESEDAGVDGGGVACEVFEEFDMDAFGACGVADMLEVLGVVVDACIEEAGGVVDGRGEFAALGASGLGVEGVGEACFVLVGGFDELPVEGPDGVDGVTHEVDVLRAGAELFGGGDGGA